MNIVDLFYLGSYFYRKSPTPTAESRQTILFKCCAAGREHFSHALNRPEGPTRRIMNGLWQHTHDLYILYMYIYTGIKAASINGTLHGDHCYDYVWYECHVKPLKSLADFVGVASLILQLSFRWDSSHHLIMRVNKCYHVITTFWLV